MAADRAKTTLMIALIIFVMIAFVLSVTTYLGFQQKDDAERKAREAALATEKANQDAKAAREEVERIRAVLGTDKQSADEVEAERNEMFDRRYAGFDKDPKSLLRLVEWLGDAIKVKDADIQRLDTEKAEVRKELQAAVTQAQSLQQAAERDRDAARDELRKVTEDFKARWAQHEQSQGQMKTEQERALGESERMKSIIAEVAKLGPLLSSKRQQAFAGGQDGQGAPWPDRIGKVAEELRDREKAIRDLNETLAKLRVADPELQDTVRNAVRDDDRIDGFDGRIASVNPADRTALIVFDSTAGLRPGLVFSVYDPDDPRPRSGARKGTVEVVSVEGPTLARGRISRESPKSPLLAGDAVATSLWAPGTAQEIVVVGYVRFGADRKQDTVTLKGLIERNGARIVDAPSPTTALVVDAGTPRPGDLAAIGSDAAAWDREEKRRGRVLKIAEKQGTRVVTLDGLLDALGLDREALEGKWLPSALEAAR